MRSWPRSSGPRPKAGRRTQVEKQKPQQKRQPGTWDSSQLSTQALNLAAHHPGRRGRGASAPTTTRGHQPSEPRRGPGSPQLPARLPVQLHATTWQPRSSPRWGSAKEPAPRTHGGVQGWGEETQGEPGHPAHQAAKTGLRRGAGRPRAQEEAWRRSQGPAQKVSDRVLTDWTTTQE